MATGKFHASRWNTIAVLLAWLLRGAFISQAAPINTTAEGFLVPQPNTVFQFPRDHGSHPRYKIEWWYVTGHLFTEDHQRFGYQATFFRQAAPLSLPSSGSALFGHDQLFMAHMALTDSGRGRFLHQERLDRNGWNAEASTNTLNLRHGDWSLTLTNPTAMQMELRGGVQAAATFHLSLSPTKPMTQFGQNGVSRKAADPEAVSHYLTFTRLATEGTLTIDGRRYAVQGESWMDHEISSSQLGPDQSGWDWASLQLNDGRDIMAYRMRRKDGSTDPHSTLAWVGTQGTLTHQGPNQFTWSARGHWTSPHTGAAYPIPIRLQTVDPDSGQVVRFDLVPLLKDQELTGHVGGIAYWEGACRVLDESGRETGRAYVELTGYANEPEH